MSKLRLIIIVLALQAIVFAGIGSYLFYSSYRDSILQKDKQHFLTNAMMVKRNLSSFLSQYIRPVRTLSRLEELKKALANKDPRTIYEANSILDTFQSSLDVDVCYLMDDAGKTIASSNRRDPDSFVGQNFSFRPYFQKAINHQPFTYLALGTTSHKRGAYYSHPVYGPGGSEPVGVAVIKASIEFIESELFNASEQIFVVTDPNGVIFITNKNDWLYKTTRKLNPGTREDLKNSKQFGKGPWTWTGLTFQDQGAVGKHGREYFSLRQDIELFPGWQLIFLQDKKKITSQLHTPLFSASGFFILVFGCLIAVSVFLLYHRASLELKKRTLTEEELRKNEEKYRSIYHNTPAMLHSIDADYKLISVSDYWLEATGYQREEVIGRNLTDFFTPESKELAEKTILPSFFKVGKNKDIPYQLVKKDGGIMDISLSCIGILDDHDRIARTLAISVDVTERNLVQKELKEAKEALSRYSKDLERIVRERTREITGILTYTPAIIYIKNEKGEYQLINPRFEKIFNISNAQIQGKSDQDRLPRRVALQLHQNDLQVLKNQEERQFTEWIEQDDGLHTYLSVKFPLYDDHGFIRGICGISTDITELQRTQDKLKKLSKDIISSQEKERAAISRELHDELGQMLTALRMDSVWLENRLHTSHPEAAERAAVMGKHIDKTIDDVRNMSFQLRPGILDDLGLIEALESLVRYFEKRSDMSFVFEHDACLELEGTETTALYRIVQEGLTNAVRHSEASRVEIRLFTENGGLCLELTDNGRGFSADAGQSSGFGISGMQERAGLIGGDLRIASNSESGTSIFCTIPLTKTTRTHEQ
ncbi:MAG: PAS domain S-box protein [Desulfohalobiaceae bacterium]|nr:PAS domain S-box protein [Desulfohalobiaceae bacterium]